MTKQPNVKKTEKKEEDVFTKLGRTIIETFLKQWKVWNTKTRIFFILATGFAIITLIHFLNDQNFILSALSFMFGMFTSLWLSSMIEDIKKLKTQQQPKVLKKNNKKKKKEEN